MLAQGLAPDQAPSRGGVDALRATLHVRCNFFLPRSCANLAWLRNVAHVFADSTPRIAPDKAATMGLARLAAASMAWTQQPLSRLLSNFHRRLAWSR